VRAWISSRRLRRSGPPSAARAAPHRSTGNPGLDPWRADARICRTRSISAGKEYIRGRFSTRSLKSYIFNETNLTNFGTFLSTCQRASPARLARPAAAEQHRTAVGAVNARVQPEGHRAHRIAPGRHDLRRVAQLRYHPEHCADRQQHHRPGCRRTKSSRANNLGNIPLPGLSKTVWSATSTTRMRVSPRASQRGARSKYIAKSRTSRTTRVQVHPW